MQEQAAKKVAEKPPPKPEDNLFVDPMELELGYGLIRLADANSGGDLLDRVTRVRHKIAQELGIILPKVRIRDNIRLDQRQYQIKIHDVPVAWGTIFADGLLAIDSGATSGKLPGMATTEPAFGRPAVLDRNRAARTGRAARLQRRRAVGGDRHASDRSRPPAQRRTAVASAGPPAARQPQAAFAQGRRRADSRRAQAASRPSGAVQSAARAGAHPQSRNDSRNAGRLTPTGRRIWDCSPNTCGTR